MKTDIPLPPACRPVRPNSVRGRIRALLPGTSEFISGTGMSKEVVRATVGIVRQETHGHYATRTLEERGVCGVRVWRLL